MPVLLASVAEADELRDLPLQNVTPRRPRETSAFNC